MNDILKYLCLSTILSASMSTAVLAEEIHSRSESSVMLKINRVQIDPKNNDKQAHKNKLVQTYIRKISNASTITKNDIERYIALINEIPGYKARYSLNNVRKSSNVKSANLMLHLQRTKASLILGANNYGNKRIGMHQFSATGQLLNPFGWNDAFIVEGLTSDKLKALSMLSAKYSKVLNSYGASANFSVSHLKNNPWFTSPVNNTTLLYIGDLEQYLMINGKSSIKVNLGLERQSISQQNVTGDSILQSYIANLWSIGTMMHYIDSTNADTSLNANLYHTLNKVRFKYSDKDAKAFDPNFGYIKLEVQRDQPLSGTFSLLGKITWHYSSNNLPSEHQFSIGQNIGRGYVQGLISSNRGIDGTLELKYTRYIHNNKLLQTAQTYVFIESVKVSKTYFPISKNMLSSVGGGVRLFTPWDLGVYLEIATPFTKNIQVGDTLIKNSTVVKFFASKEFKV